MVVDVSSEVKTDVVDLLEFLTSNPEVAGEERLASGAIATLLRKYGFDVTEKYEGYETAFHASAGSSGPRVVFLAKYDALPNFRNGETAHGCGHNWVAAHMVASALLLREVCAQEGTGVTISVVGAPTESPFSRVVNIEEWPAITAADLVFHSHLNDVNLLHSFALPINHVRLRIIGERSQAFSFPDAGKNALVPAMEYVRQVRGLLDRDREFDRINPIIFNGGSSTDLIPFQTEVRVGIGGATKNRTDELTAQAEQLAENISRSFDIEIDFSVANEFPEIVNVPELQALAAQEFRELGAPLDEFPKVLGRTGLDMARVSFSAPLMFAFFGAEDWLSHQPTASRVESSHSPFAVEQLWLGAEVYASVACDVISTEGRLERIREAWATERDEVRARNEFSLEAYREKFRKAAGGVEVARGNED